MRDSETAPRGPDITPDEPTQPRGSSQGGIRQYNERVVLEVVRLQGALPAADIARQTQLTAQTVSLITKRLLDDGLLLKGEPQRGKIGQPSVPLSLNPDGAFAIGIKVGRRSLDTLLIDFVGQPRQRHTLDYRHAEPDKVLAEIALRLKDIRRSLGPAQRLRVQGIGVAAPLSMGGWQQLLGVPARTAQKWQSFDLAAAIGEVTELPVTLIKDTAAACLAELVAGHGRSVRSYLYVFVDTFIGGGLVLDGRLRLGSNGNAGAIGSLPLWLARGDSENPPAQLLSVASLLNLEQIFGAAGLAVGAALDDRALQPPWQAHSRRWLSEAGAAIAQAAHVAACMLDVEAVVLDGSFTRGMQAALLQAVEQGFARYSWEGTSRPRLLPGSIGSDARALGGALLPLYANFAPDRELFLKV
jgi:predicted NBD/HSP70 family sugar kinase